VNQRLLAGGIVGGGIVATSAGAALVYPPAGLIVLGVLLMGSLWVDF
jgi:hypothetical protein